MDYGALASELTGMLTAFTEHVNTYVEPSSFEKIWTGDAANTLITELKTAKDISKFSGYVNNFITALKNLQSYKTKKADLETKKTARSTAESQLSLLTNTPENKYAIQSLNSTISGLDLQIKLLESSLASLKTTINTNLSAIGAIEATVTPKTSADFKTNLDGYICDIYELLQIFQSGTLTKIPDGGSLYDYYSKEEVQGVIDSIHEQYSGREAAVNSALAVISMAAKQGMKLDYDFGGGHSANGITTLDAVANGIDCSAFASWVVNQGSTETFQTRGSKSLLRVGAKTSYEDAQPGDILVSSGHAQVIIANDPTTSTFLVAEASGSKSGVMVRAKSYKSLVGEYIARDMSSYYK